jgi:hypothetical protein
LSDLGLECSDSSISVLPDTNVIHDPSIVRFKYEANDVSQNIDLTISSLTPVRKCLCSPSTEWDAIQNICGNI